MLIRLTIYEIDECWIWLRSNPAYELRTSEQGENMTMRGRDDLRRY